MSLVVSHVDPTYCTPDAEPLKGKGTSPLSSFLQNPLPQSNNEKTSGKPKWRGILENNSSLENEERLEETVTEEQRPRT